jgi:4-amino-4-deoxy-L-arabinose transferase-like glycosyltransferase
MSNAQAPLRTSLLLVGAGLIILSQIVIQDLPLDQRSILVWLTLVGIALFLASAINVLANKQYPARIEHIIRQIANWFHIEEWQVVFLLTSPLFAWLAWWAAGEGRKMINPAVAIIAWFLAIATVILGSFRGSLEGLRFEPRSLILPLVLTLAAFLVRGLAMDRFPIVLTGDEGRDGIEAVRALQGELNNPFISAGYSFPSLYYLFQALSIRFLGQTTEALRLTSALVGTLTVTALFYVGSAMFNRRTGLLAAIFLAAYSFHIHFSRIGLNNIWDGLWYIILIGALWHGWEHEQNKSFALAGFSLGMAQYFYPSGRALVIPIFGWLLLMGVFRREKFKRVFSGILIMFIVTSVIILPLAIFYWHHPNEYMAPLRRVSIFGPVLDGLVQSTGQPVWLIILKQIWKSLQGFTYLPVTFFYEPGTPLLRPVAASLFLMGLLLLLSRGRDGRFLLLALWILTFGLIGGLSESTSAAQRYVAAAPVCALLIGYSLNEITSILEELWPQFNRIPHAVVISVALLLAIDELDFYFNTYTQKTVVEGSHNNTTIAQHLANYLKEKPADLQVIFFGAPSMGYYSVPSLQYLVPDIKGIDATLPWESFDKSTITGTDLVFIFLPGNENELDTIKRDYPGGKTYREMASDGKPLYWYYEYTSK